MLKVTHTPRGTGGIYYISGEDKQEVNDRADAMVAGMDFMRSPHKGGPCPANDPDSWIATVTYYGLD